MLNRQKSLICFLNYAGGETSRLKLVKWSFLLTKETETGGGTAYYDFLPYHFGPYSFTLKHEIGSLIKNGYISKINNKKWGLTNNGKSLLRITPNIFHSEAKTIIWKYGKLGESELLESVYSRYLWYTVNSNIEGGRRAEMPVADTAVYTIGYEAQSVDGFLNMLLKRGIKSLLDVRRNPVARRFGFHKSTLSKLCENIGISYIHIPELGLPSSLRRDLKTRDDYLALLKHYDKEVIPNNKNALSVVGASIEAKPSAIMCMEADVTLCHRSRVAAAVSEMTSLPVVHLKKE